MRTIFISVLACVACFGSLAMGQAEPDWISKVRVSDDGGVMPDKSGSVPPKPESQPEPMPPSVAPSMPPAPLDSMFTQMEDAIRRANDAAERAEVVAKELNSQRRVGDWQSDADRITKLEEAVKELRSRKQWTEGEIRTIAKDEAEKLIKATVKMPSGETKQIGADSLQVSVSGYSGTFNVPPGGVIVEVDGKPVRGVATMGSGATMSRLAVTPEVQLQTVPQQRGVVRFWSLPNRFGSSSGTCRSVFNRATGRWEQQCN